MMREAAVTFHPLPSLRKKGRLRYDTPDPEHDTCIVEAIARAMYWHGLLDAGVFKSVRELAEAEGLRPTTVGRMLRLARLSPDIIEQLLWGRQSRRLTLLWLMRNDIPLSWDEQHRMVEGFAREAT